METSGLALLSTYPSPFLLFLQVFLGTTLLTGILYWVAKRYRFMMPAVRERDVHVTPKPRVGGLAMWLALAVSLLAVGIGKHAGLLDFHSAPVAGLDRVVWGILAAMGVLLVFGLLDDLYSLKPSLQLLGQFLAATALIIGGLQVDYIFLPLHGAVRLDVLFLHLPSWLGGDVSVWSALLVYIWTITMINVVNFFDGLDGLAGSVSMTSAFVLVLVSLRLGFTGAATLGLVLFGVTAGYLPWNWYPSKLIMGTIGSQTLGLMLAVTAIISGAKVATAVLVLGIPLLDAFVVIGRRLLAGESPFKADQRHLHHRLLKIGLSTPWVVVVINAVALIFGAFAVHTQHYNTKGLLTLILAICMVLFIVVTYLLERRTR